jgi:uncharacterized Rossmann fold enzyme
VGEVRCFYGWDAQKAAQYKFWVESDPQRYLLFIEETPKSTILEMPHPRIRACSPEVFEEIALEFLFLPFTYEHHPLLQKLASLQAQIFLRALDFDDHGLKLIRNVKAHLMKPIKLVKGLENSFTGVPAIVCGAGPSLSSEIARFQDHALLIGCGAGVEALLKMKVRPHFAAHVDADPLHQFTAIDIPLLKLLRTSSKTSAQYRGLHILAPGSGNFALESWVEEALGIASGWDGGWTVGTFGVAMAHFLGCNPIILAGIDLAADSNKIYAPGVKTATRLDPFFAVKNRQGEAKVSRIDWVLAAEWLDIFAKRHSHVRFGTLANKGLDIPSIPLVSLDVVEGVSGIGERVQKALVPLPESERKHLWEEMAASAERCLCLCQALLKEMEKIFPRPPSESGTCALLEHDLTKELAYQKILEPVWNYWQYPLRRYTPEEGLFLNRILLFQSLCEKIDALP